MITALALLVVTYYCYQYVLFLFENGRVSNSLRVPMYLLMLCAPIGLLLMSVQFFATALVNLTRKDGA
ncbi:TRAP transporter small permease subunit [Brevibacillus humidisoli]|uniref:TRAP transporter small permease subunit n=1 Tax=Brevibacillus humidisoli TaxID=2895522 RepID=UPI001E4CDCCC|nr:TRAP transporter small permease subunit [Brevibacillus humidisoli]